MAAYNSLQLTPPIYPIPGVGMGGRTSHHGRGQITTTTALVAGDTVALFDLPKNSRVLGGFVKSDKLDSGTAIRVNVGIPGTPDLFFSASTVSSTGGVDRVMAAAGVDYVTNAKTRVLATVSTGPTGGQNGNLVVVINYTVEEPA